MGVRHHVNKTLGKITVGEIRTCLDGEYEYFDDEWSAFLRHKAVKEGKAKELAMKYRKDLDTRVFDHLMSYDVKIV